MVVRLAGGRRKRPGGQGGGNVRGRLDGVATFLWGTAAGVVLTSVLVYWRP
ncbi:MAG: hypothetical protein M5U14_00340 [Acidimicrobiia bacterium]|nr:hypothetical protein [Acidimicrobiia bacterium]